MIEAPKIGAQCWIVTDFWEKLYAVPVTIVAGSAGSDEFVCRWEAAEEVYEGAKLEDLYGTERDARAAIRKRRGLA